MKFLCNGFNLYGQLASPGYLLEKFTPVFGGYTTVKDICVGHTFSALNLGKSCKIITNGTENDFGSSGEVIKMCTNDVRLVFLDDNGKLIKINLEDIDNPSEISGMLLMDSNEKIVNISCSSKLAVAYSDKGSLFNIPHKLDFMNEYIIDIQCGKEHCLLLDEHGNVYTFGRGSRGQLGHGQLEDELEPKQVDGLAGIKITQIAAGGWHSCALSKDGDLYTWGWNGNGQLGLGIDGEPEEASISVMASPRVIDFVDSQTNVMKIACGGRHTIVLLDDNRLYGCGWNKYKQLNNQDQENVYTFTYIHDLSNEEVLQLKCGPWNSVILCK
ncbi:hypothetical protein NQ315_010751 [Exocentrus adspersus]|uniref:RCC1 domain-containing protein 1 n=1 Tax=Exocentrus adspersus TaxID=1586481 RepID=A0AAV8VUJ4_9CUCU|nr:hypothetical protein NQ315_010751 [Exocentrus adspersus]